MFSPLLGVCPLTCRFLEYLQCTAEKKGVLPKILADTTIVYVGELEWWTTDVEVNTADRAPKTRILALCPDRHAPQVTVSSGSQVRHKSLSPDRFHMLSCCSPSLALRHNPSNSVTKNEMSPLIF